MKDVAEEAAESSTEKLEAGNINPLGELLGEVFWLIGRTPKLRAHTVGEMYDLVAAAVEARSFRLYRQKQAPLAFVVWGLLDAEQEERLRAGQPLTAAQLRSGERAWAVLVASPFIPNELVLDELRKSDFPDRPLMTMV